ncbi:prefoldin subunit alpha [Candidatus Woesearchaeota archaeon]|nr:prefoldin subunit alpha [Candidatus Woesearchaeota archaeon]
MDQTKDQLYAEFRILSEQINQMQQHLSNLDHQLAELIQLQNALTDLESLKVGSKVLIPLGSGVFLQGELKDNKEIVMAVGSAVSVKKTVGDAKNIVEGQISEMKQITAQLEQELSQGAMQYRMVQHQLQHLMADKKQ